MYEDILKLRCRSLVVTLHKAFLKNKKGSETSIFVSLPAWSLKKNVSFVILYYLIKFRCLVVFTLWNFGGYVPNGHILVDSPSIRRRNSSWKVRRNYIDFERLIHVEIMTSIRCGNFDVDSTFKIHEISMSFPRGFLDVVSTSNWRNFCTDCFHFIIS